MFLFSFTGGDTGIAISKKAGMVPLQMELGGKDACIILEDADLDLAAANIIKGGFSYRLEDFLSSQLPSLICKCSYKSYIFIPSRAIHPC